MKILYDSVNAAAICENAALIAGYVDGMYEWSEDDWNRHPSARAVRIAVFPTTNDGDVLDCESGNAAPNECPGWIAMRQAAGLEVPTIYCNLWSMPAVQAYCEGLTYDLWVADWTGEPHIPEGAVACQFVTKWSYDVTLCSDTWPRV